MHVGKIIHSARKSKKMTLLELSQGSGVAVATLSRIENGIMTGTLDSHIRICKTLNIELPDLYKDLVASNKKVELREKKASTEVFVHAKKAISEILTANAMSKKMMPTMIRIQKGGATHAEETKQGVEKFVYVVEGKIEAVVGEAVYKLAKGDTMYFDASARHHFKNISEGAASFLCVICPPVV